MRLPIRHALLATAVPALLLPLAAARAADAAEPAAVADTDSGDNIVVTAGGQTRTDATPLGLAVKDTPQSVTIIDRQQMDDFAITNVNDLLDHAVGINVDRDETDRTEYNSRGFDVTSFQYDGIGLPMYYGYQVGDVDTALFQDVEVVRGANALMTGVGNPSATINYVRKRPTDDLSATVSEEVGSNTLWRTEGDVNVPITDTLAVRLIGVHDQHNTYLDYNHVNRNVGGAIVRWQVTPSLRLTAGYTYQKNDAQGVLWGALPLIFADGSKIDWKRSATTAASWTYENTKDQTAFAEAQVDLGHDWSLKAIGTYRDQAQHSKLLYADGTPDKATGEGIAGEAGIYADYYKQYFGDLYLSGPFTLFGREQNLALGLSVSHSHAREFDNTDYDDSIDYGSVYNWSSSSDPVDPENYTDNELASVYTDKLTRLYGATRLSFTDKLHVVAGASMIWLRSTGYQYTASVDRRNSRLSPYAGAIYDLTSHVSLYGSYTDIFNPQSEVGTDGVRLDPAHGTSFEAGVKSNWFGGKLYATAAVFRAEQKNLASDLGAVGDEDSPCLVGQIGSECYTGLDTVSKGFEIEVAGKLTDNWTLNGGFTGLRIHADDGEAARTYVPRQTFKLNTTYSVPSWNDLKLGAQLRWQSSTYTDLSDADGNTVKYTQKSYAVVDLMAGIRLVDKVHAAVNLRNLTDKKYLNSLSWGQAFYAAPRTVMFTVTAEL